MGAQMVYLPKPVTAKENEDGGNFGKSGLNYGVTGMQGWRRNMEDSHLAVTELDDKASLFGVFDGHGGRGVSKFAAKRLPELIKDTEAYKQGDYVRALERSFLLVDEKLREAEGRREVEDLDRPDANAPSQPMAVPRRVLQRFLCNSGAGGDEEVDAVVVQPDDTENVADKAAAEKQPGKNGDTDKIAEPEEKRAASVAVEQRNGEAAEPKEKADADAEAEEGEEGEDEDFVVQLDEEGDGENDEDIEVDAILDEDADWDGEEMALVDPSRLTRDPTPEAQGCTAVVVLMVRNDDGKGSRLFCANAGDSRAILSRGGKVVALSEDHKPENDEETARITKAGGFVQQMPGGARVQGDLNLSRAMGDLRYKKPENLPPEEQILTAFPEVRTFTLGEEDEFMVLGCDGIWERMGNQEMVDFVRPRLAAQGENGKAAPLSQICGEICDNGLCPSMNAAENEGFDGTGCDNMTVVVVELKKQIDAGSAKRPLEEPQGDETNDGEANKKHRTADSEAT